MWKLKKTLKTRFYKKIIKTHKKLNKKRCLQNNFGPVEKLAKQYRTWQSGQRLTCNQWVSECVRFNVPRIISQSMQNTSNIENAEINVSTKWRFSVFSLYNFIRNNTQISYIFVGLKFKKTLENKKNVINAFSRKRIKRIGWLAAVSSTVLGQPASLSTLVTIQ